MKEDPRLLEQIKDLNKKVDELEGYLSDQTGKYNLESMKTLRLISEIKSLKAKCQEVQDQNM